MGSSELELTEQSAGVSQPQTFPPASMNVNSPVSDVAAWLNRWSASSGNAEHAIVERASDAFAASAAGDGRPLDRRSRADDRDPEAGHALDARASHREPADGG